MVTFSSAEAKERTIVLIKVITSSTEMSFFIVLKLLPRFLACISCEKTRPKLSRIIPQ